MIFWKICKDVSLQIYEIQFNLNELPNFISITFQKKVFLLSQLYIWNNFDKIIEKKH